MGIQRFNADVDRAREALIPRVSNLKRGDAGEISFVYEHDELSTPILMHLIAHDATSYPKNVGFLAFAESDDDVGDLTDCLEAVCAKCRWRDVSGAVCAITEAVTAQIEQISEAEFADDFSSWSDDPYELLEPMELSSQAGDSLQGDDNFDGPLNLSSQKEALRRLKKALRKTQTTGTVVGIYPFPGTPTPEIVALSFPASKLGIPGAVLQAWGLRSTDHVVLLLRISEAYPSTEEFLELSSRQSVLEFHFGKCAAEKPSAASVYSVYDVTRQSTRRPNSNGYDALEDEVNPPFELINMSTCIDKILNSDLMKLVSIRRKTKAGWDEAQELLSKYEVLAFPASLLSNEYQENEYMMEAADVHALDEPTVEPLADNNEVLAEVPSIPLIAMQFSLRRLANCTKYCMVCSCRLKQNLEALKPYVCSSDLCLFQYLTLGLGSSIEHEIINSPYVVDILISFLYSALASNTVRELPTGLHIRSVCLNTDDRTRNTHIQAEANFQLNEIRFYEALPEWSSFREGDHFVISTRHIDSGGASAHSLVRKWCRVICHEGGVYRFECFRTQPFTGGIVGNAKTTTVDAPAGTNRQSGTWESVNIFGYWCDLDNLPRSEHLAALNIILDGLPTVLEMRDYLTAQPGRRLSKWSRINSPSLSILNWTVASNRSLIAQDDVVPDYSNNTETWTKVQGMDHEWMQFRFLQGSPEKERLFEAQVARLRQSPLTATRPPTIFAWHGSRFKNWHSIIRTGLDFRTVENGRASGHGVYFSNSFSTSLGYCRGVATQANPNHNFKWLASVLRPIEAICICELINEPESFVSKSPHYVLNQLTWIQCRYLFLRVSATTEAMDKPLYQMNTSNTPGYVKQDPLYTIQGFQKELVRIPIVALPRARQKASIDESDSVFHTGRTDGLYTPAETLVKTAPPKRRYDVDDISLFLGNESDGDDDMLIIGSRKRNSTQNNADKLGMSPTSRVRPFSVISISSTESIQDEVPSRNAFDPTKLDFSSLRILPPPDWAAVSRAALRRLSMDIKNLHDEQATNTSDTTGYYVHTEQTDNLFQWIVQLHSFDKELPLAKDMERDSCSSIVLELRFGPSYPLAPPFVRVIRPRFVPFMEGGGGHVTQGGAICLELLTTNGWNPAIHIGNVLTQIRAALCETERPARLATRQAGMDYAAGEAATAFVRLATAHGWGIPDDFKKITEVL